MRRKNEVASSSDSNAWNTQNNFRWLCRGTNTDFEWFSKAGEFQLKMPAFRSPFHRLHRRICGGRSRNHWRRLTKNDEVSFRRSVVGYASPMAWLFWKRDDHQQLLAFLDFQQRSWTGSIANLYTVHCIIYNWKYKCTAIAQRDIAFITIIHNRYATARNFQRNS
jgi:hypothetical protein